MPLFNVCSGLSVYAHRLVFSAENPYVVFILMQLLQKEFLDGLGESIVTERPLVQMLHVEGITPVDETTINIFTCSNV